jgi:hypothetical protein
MSSFVTKTPKILFAGPTHATLKDKHGAMVAGFELRSPAQRGDVLALLNTRPGILVLVDGVFHQSLAVGHAELLAAIKAEWKVWGLSSIGAIRAYEMRSLGMLGFGRVYEHFLGDDDFQDDEVAQLHAPGPEYFPITEPMVHLRYFIRELEVSGTLSHSSAQRIVDELKAVWYGSRSTAFLLSLIDRCSGPGAGMAARMLLGDLNRFRVKTQDLARFLEQRAWLHDCTTCRPTPAPYSRTPSECS